VFTFLPTSTLHSEHAVAAAGQSERSEEQRDELKAEIKLLKQDLHTSQKEFILACRYNCTVFISCSL